MRICVCDRLYPPQHEFYNQSSVNLKIHKFVQVLFADALRGLREFKRAIVRSVVLSARSCCLSTSVA